MNNIKKNISLLLSGLLILGGCSNLSKEETNKEELKEVTVVLDWTPNTNHTGMYVALKNGYYKDVGLTVNIVQPPEDGALQLVSANRADFGISFQEEVAIAISADTPLPIVSVAAILQHNESGILSLKSDDINSPKDMEGMTYASWNSPFEIAVLKSVIANDGGSFDNVNSVPNTVTDVVTALNTNIDAVWVYYGWDGIAAELAGFDTNYFAFRDIEPVLDFYTPIIVTNENRIKENSDLVATFISATKKGYEFAIENPEESAQILVEYAPEISLELAMASQIYLADKYQAEASSWGIIDENRWNEFYTWMENEGIVNKSIVGKGFTNEFVGN